MTTTKTSETEALEADIELTRRHLAQTVQELSHQVNFPRRIKESAREHPKALAAVGGAVALGVGAAAWIVGRGK